MKKLALLMVVSGLVMSCGDDEQPPNRPADAGLPDVISGAGGAPGVGGAGMGGRGGSGAGGSGAGGTVTDDGGVPDAVADAAEDAIVTDPDAAVDSAAPADMAAVDSGTDAVVPANRKLVYVGGYDPEITILGVDTTTGALAKLGSKEVEVGDSPSWMAFAPGKNVLYALNEAGEGTLGAYSFDAVTGALTLINRADIGGEFPNHIAVDPSGKWILAANYDSGSISVTTIKPDSGIGTQSDTEVNCAGAHQVVFAGAGKFVFVPCTDANYVRQYKFADGALTAASPATVNVPEAPRHMAFNPSETHAYVLAQTDNTVVWFDFDKVAGTLSNPRTVAAVDPDGEVGNAAEIAIHRGGKFMYVSNRSDNSIAILSLDATTGAPKVEAYHRMNSVAVRHFAFVYDASGDYMLAASQTGGTVAVLKINTTTGALTLVGTPVAVAPQPGIIAVQP